MNAKQRLAAYLRVLEARPLSFWFVPPPKEREEPGKPPPPPLPPRPLVRFWFDSGGDLQVKAVLIRDREQHRLLDWLDRLESVRRSVVFGANVCPNCRPGHTKAHELTRKAAVHIGEDFYRAHSQAA